MVRCFAAWETDFPALTRSWRAKTVSGGNGGRPGVRPCFRALTKPSLVRSGIRRRSKCAMAPKTWNTSSPAADVESIRSPGPIGLICLALRPSTVPWSSLGERSGRSGRMVAGVSLGLARSSGAARPGRLNVLLEITSPNARVAPFRIGRSFRPDGSRSVAETPRIPECHPRAAWCLQNGRLPDGPVRRQSGFGASDGRT